MKDYMKKFRLDGKTAAVCGGLGLIGKEISIALAQAGAKVIVLDIDEKLGRDFQGYCKKNNLKVTSVFFDITKTAEYKKIDSFFAENINIWVNAAYPRTGDWNEKPENVSYESWMKNVDMQMNSYCLITRDVAELMKKNSIKGSIINLGSIYGVVSPDFGIYEGTGMICPAAYSAIKAGILNFSRYAAAYYGKAGIRINCICLGGIFDKQDDKFVKAYSNKTSLKRMGNSEEAASSVLFLASEASSYITGTAFIVDGGWTSI